jgi:hypothetical protein
MPSAPTDADFIREQLARNEHLAAGKLTRSNVRQCS